MSDEKTLPEVSVVLSVHDNDQEYFAQVEIKRESFEFLGNPKTFPREMRMAVEIHRIIMETYYR